jgi:hypothetical protein
MNACHLVHRRLLRGERLIINGRNGANGMASNTCKPNNKIGSIEMIKCGNGIDFTFFGL